MGRPDLEVGDVFRAHRQAWRQSVRLSLGQLKVMSAIEQCRSAALGGNLLRCNACAHTEIAYNSCLMVTTPLRGVGMWLLRPCGDPPLREGG